MLVKEFINVDFFKKKQYNAFKIRHCEVNNLKKLIGLMWIWFGLAIITCNVYFQNKGSSIQQDALTVVEEAFNGVSVDTIGKEDRDLSDIVEGAVGIVNIPSINVRSVIMEGVDQETLKYYVGWFPQTNNPGETGNFAIIGHNNNMYNKVFNDLSKLSNGDIIEILTLEKTFKYKVFDKFEVFPKETYVLDGNDERKEITVITCTNDSRKRTIIKGILVE